MRGRKDYLTSLEQEESALASQKSKLQEKRKFYNSCQSFSGEEKESVLKHIVSMISQVEGKEYVDTVFSKEEKDHYQTEWISPYEGQYGVSGAELAATAEPREVLVKGKTYFARMIVDQETCDTFHLFSFSSCREYQENLSRILATKKFVDLNDWGIKAETFSEMFPYVSTFLERLTDWRLENGKKEIPEDVLASIASTVTGEVVAEVQKGAVKQNKKG